MNPSEIIEVAKKHVNGWEFAELSGITWTPSFNKGGLWHPPHNGALARIEVGWEQDSDVLWHEIFHSVFHNCPLKKNNGWWGEAFCNAFSEVNRGVFFKASIEPSDREKVRTDLHWRRYIVPCILILSRVDFNRHQFWTFWTTANEIAKTDFHFVPAQFSLNEILGYNPETGYFSPSRH